MTQRNAQKRSSNEIKRKPASPAQQKKIIVIGASAGGLMQSKKSSKACLAILAFRSLLSGI